MSGLLKRKKKAAPVAEAPEVAAPTVTAPAPTPTPAPKPSKSFIAEKRREERAEREEARVEAEELAESERLAKRKRLRRIGGMRMLFSPLRREGPGYTRTLLGV